MLLGGSGAIGAGFASGLLIEVSKYAWQQVTTLLHGPALET